MHLIAPNVNAAYTRVCRKLVQELYHNNLNTVDRALSFAENLAKTGGGLLQPRNTEMFVSPSRNGPVLAFFSPFGISYNHPDECVLFDADRDANPFFHLFESYWMLAGHNDVEFLRYFNSRIHQYSDDGIRFHGAYGARMWWYDQIFHVAHQLKKDNYSRRAVIALWQPEHDSGYTGLDMPCNVMLTFTPVPGVGLCMNVLNRSNDLVWGMLGANAVHFSFIHRAVCELSGMPLGQMRQLSTNAHLYCTPEMLAKVFATGEGTREGNPYRTGRLYLSQGMPGRLGSHYMPVSFNGELLPRAQGSNTIEETMQATEAMVSAIQWHAGINKMLPQREDFGVHFMQVLRPMFNAWVLHKHEKATGDAINLLKDEIENNPIADRAYDWLLAGYEWLVRRADKKENDNAK